MWNKLMRNNIIHIKKLVSTCKNAKGTGDRFTPPHVLDDSLTWSDQAGVRLKLKVTAT
jgi:hypothetical protein